jgi:hypothetical protein
MVPNPRKVGPMKPLQGIYPGCVGHFTSLCPSAVLEISLRLLMKNEGQGNSTLDNIHTFHYLIYIN